MKKELKWDCWPCSDPPRDTRPHSTAVGRISWQGADHTLSCCPHQLDNLCSSPLRGKHLSQRDALGRALLLNQKETKWKGQETPHKGNVEAQGLAS